MTSTPPRAADEITLPAPRTVLSLDHVSRSFGEGEQRVDAIIDVSLGINPGTFAAVMGPSGSGKSTLLGLAGGLDQPTSGTVSVCGEPLRGMSRDDLARVRRRQLGFVFQDYNLVPTLTAVENVSLPLELDGASAKRSAMRLRSPWNVSVCPTLLIVTSRRCRVDSASGSPSRAALSGTAGYSSPTSPPVPLILRRVTTSWPSSGRLPTRGLPSSW